MKITISTEGSLRGTTVEAAGLPTGTLVRGFYFPGKSAGGESPSVYVVVPDGQGGKVFVSVTDGFREFPNREHQLFRAVVLGPAVVEVVE